MASLASVSSFAAVKVPATAGVRGTTAASSSASRVVCSAAGSPWQKVGKALVATGAGLLMAVGAATADTTVKLGDEDGSLVFKPSSVTVKAGDKLNFINNKGFPHNVIFDEDAVPAGVKADAISQEEYLNGPGETFSVTLTVPGTYEVYCEPHAGAGMKATITVN